MMEERSLEDLEREANKPYTVAVIPCKVGSRRLPDKNFLEVGKYPMVVWTVLKAMSCPHIDLVCISTDDPDELTKRAPQLNLSAFDKIIVIPRMGDCMHPETPIFTLIHDALKALAEEGKFERRPTHVVMLQPNVPTLQQEVIDDLVRAVVEGPYNVARHFCALVDDTVWSGKDWLHGPMTGGCDAYKIAAILDLRSMDSYNYAVMTTDPEVHTEEDLEAVRELHERRLRDDDGSAGQ